MKNVGTDQQAKDKRLTWGCREVPYRAGHRGMGGAGGVGFLSGSHRAPQEEV